jgi:hypothetical protein
MALLSQSPTTSELQELQRYLTLEELAELDSLLRTEADSGYSLPGAELSWQEWIAKYFPHVASRPMGPRHEKLWAWLEALAPGIRPPPRVEVWPRGGGKSSTTELGTVRVGAKLTRRFVLYVCGTQDQADYHTQSIASLFDHLGAEPLLNKMGRPRGWRRDQLRTANGFNLAGFGVEGAQRGIKVDQYRPDLIIIDDIDSEDDSLDAVIKKFRGLRTAVLPTGSPDCAVVYVQNMVQSNGVMAQLVDLRADFLLDRDIPTIEPAVYNLKYHTEDRGPGLPPLYRVDSGQPTWEGQNLQVVENQINTWGFDAFMREAQHDVRRAGDLFFRNFDGIHEDRDGRHICAPFDVPIAWNFFGGLDWGYDAPFCFLLFAVNTEGQIFVIREILERRMENKDQAKAIVKLLGSLGISKSACPIYADPSMWAKKKKEDQIGRADIEDFWSQGLSCVEANNNRQHGWTNLRSYIAAKDALRIFKGCCPKLCDDLSTSTHDKDRTEDLDDDNDIPPGHRDSVNTARYALMSRPWPADKPKSDLAHLRDLFPQYDGAYA